jgi:HK97 family phage portal protein
MFENSKQLLRGLFGFNEVYSGTDEAYIDQIIKPLMWGTKNTFNTSDAEKISAISTSIKILSDTISRLPVHVYSIDTKGHLPDREDYRYSLLHFSPDDIITSQSFFSALEYNRNLKGNAFAIIERNSNTGKTQGLHFVPSSYIGGYKLVNGELYYVYYEPIDDGKSRERLLNSSDVLHFKMTTKNSFWGINPIEAQRTNLSKIYKADVTIDKYYENNAFGTKVLKSSIPDAAFQKTVKEGIAQFKTINVGASNAGNIISLPPFCEIQELSLDIIDEAFISSQKFNNSQIASFYGIPAHMIGVYEYTKFNNVEQENLNFKSMTIAAICRMYRAELEFKLLTEEERKAGKSIEFAINELISLDTNTKMAYYKAMRNELSVLTSNQIAMFEGLPTYEGGDIRVGPNGYGNIQDKADTTNDTVIPDGE